MRRIENYELKHSSGRVSINYRDRHGAQTLQIHTDPSALIELFRDQDHTYVLSWNPRFPCVGLERFQGSTPQGRVFLNSYKAMENVLGSSGFYLPSATLARKLSQSMASPEELERRDSQQPADREGGSTAEASARRHALESRCLEIDFDDLTPQAQKSYLEFYQGEPPYGPIAVLEREESGEPT